MRRALTPLLMALLASCEPMATSWPEKVDFPVLQKKDAVAPAATSTLKVMTWNVKYGGGRIDFWFDLWGDRTFMTLDEVEHNMAGVYALINEVQPDILITNEIEIDSKRSAFYDMVQGILDHTDLRWAAYTPVWQARFVPSEGVGRMNMGNCVFSRFPIVQNTRIAQVDRTDQDPATKTFYLHRAVGRAEIQVGAKRVAVFAVHTEAYDSDRTNSKQQAQILEVMKAETLPFVMAGDLNALMPGSVKTNHFNDEAPSSIGTAFEQPPYNPEDLRPFFDAFDDAIGLTRYGTTEDQQSHFYSHSVIGPDKVGANGVPGFWNRRLDYLFTQKTNRWKGAVVLQKPGVGFDDFNNVVVVGPENHSGIVSNPLELSDHCPVVGLWEVLQ